MKTSDQYLNKIRQAHEVAKTGVYASYLVQPSPALMKSFCILLYQQKTLSAVDRGILKHFFGWTHDDEALRRMEHFDTEKLKPVCRFLLGQTQTPHQKILDLLALLTDTHPRPYAKYLKSDATGTDYDLLQGEIQYPTPPQSPVIPPKKPWKSFAVGGLLLAGAVTGSMLTNSPPCEKMVWNGTSFDKIECHEEGRYPNRVIELYDATRHKSFQKVIPCDTTTFFKYNQPKLWYYKTKEGAIECFSAPGLHPESGATLKKITPYMIQKYGLKGDCLGR